MATALITSVALRSPAPEQPEPPVGAIPGSELPECTGQSGLSVCVKSGSFADATTTLVSIANPFAATSTVDISLLDITHPSTSTALFYVSTTTVASHAAATFPALPADVDVASLIDGASVATGTIGRIVNGVTVGPDASHFSAGAGSKARITVGPGQRVTVFASSALPGGFTEVTNTFQGKYVFRFFR